MIDEATDSAAHQHHVEAGKADGERGDHEEPSVPAMKRRRSVSAERRNLNRATEDDDHG